MAFLAGYFLTVGRIPFERIVGPAILVDAVGALAVIGYHAAKVGVADDDAIVGSQVGGVGVLLLIGGGDADVLSFISSVIRRRVYVPNPILVSSTHESVGAKSIEGDFQCVASMVLRHEGELAGELSANGVFCSARTQQAASA